MSEQNRVALASSFGVAPSEIVRIYNGVPRPHPVDVSALEQLRRDVRAELGLPEDAVLVLTVGRLHPQKRHADLLETAPELVARWPRVHLLWVGDGFLYDGLASEIDKRELGGHVHLLGWRGDVPRLLHASDLFVLPSAYEGLPFALLEAMAHGLPVIASRVGGVEEIVDHGRTGLLVSPGSPEELYDSLAGALSHPGDIERLGAAGRERTDAFSVDRMVEQTMAVLSGLAR